MKHGSCFERMLEESLTESNALNAKYSEYNHLTDLASYELNKYELRHFLSQLRLKANKKCNRCKGKDGIPKNIYLTKNEAYTKADIRYDEEGIDLVVYRCKYDNGWHLTKSN